MSNAINSTQNNMLMPSYDNRTQQVQSAQRQIARIDRQIAGNDDRISITKEIIANNNKLITALKESRDLLQESRDISQRIIDKSEQLLACYEKLLEIRRAKNSANNTAVIVPQQLQTPVVSLNHNNPVKVLEKYQVAPVFQAPKSVDMAPINADATQKLGDVLFDYYKDIDQTLSRNIRERFFQELGYDADKNIIASVNSSLERVFNTFAKYLKMGEYSHLKGNNNFLTDLQNRLLSYNVEC